MARRSARSLPKSKQDSSIAQLLAALKFCAIASHEIGPPNETHTILKGQWAQAGNATITACARITEDIDAIPRTTLLIEALSKCGQNLSITQLDQNRISIKSDKFRAIVPCLEAGFLTMVPPDNPIAAIDDTFKIALGRVAEIASEKGENFITASILMQSRSVMATDRSLLIEAWHGIDLPPGLVLPKVTVTALINGANKLTRFGFSDRTATFYFDNDSWLRTGLYAQQWPELQSVLNVPCNPLPIPPDFFAAVNAISEFSTDGFLYFQENMLCAHWLDNATGATYQVQGLPKGPAFNAKRLKLIAPYAKFADFSIPDRMMFFGDNIRGILTGRSLQHGV